MAQEMVGDGSVANGSEAGLVRFNLVGFCVVGVGFLVVLASHELVPDFVAIFVLEGEVAPEPEEQVEEVDADEGLQQLVGELVGEDGLGGLVLEVDHDGEHFGDHHEDEAEGPLHHDHPFHGGGDAPAGRQVHRQRTHSDDRADHAQDHHRDAVQSRPREPEEQQHPRHVARRVRVPLNPVEAQHDRHEPHRHSDADRDHPEPKQHLIVRAGVELRETHQNQHRQHHRQNQIQNQHPVEEGSREPLRAASHQNCQDVHSDDDVQHDIPNLMEVVVAGFRGDFADHRSNKNLKAHLQIAEVHIE